MNIIEQMLSNYEVTTEADLINALKENQTSTEGKAFGGTVQRFATGGTVKQIVPGYKKEVLKGVSNLEDYGLKEPFASIVIFAKDRSKPDTIFVGDKTPTSSSCYMRLGHSRDVIISTEMTRNLMNKNLYHLRDKNFLNIDSNDIDAIKIKSGKMVLKLVKKDKNWWKCSHL